MPQKKDSAKAENEKSENMSETLGKSMIEDGFTTYSIRVVHNKWLAGEFNGNKTKAGEGDFVFLTQIKNDKVAKLTLKPSVLADIAKEVSAIMQKKESLAETSGEEFQDAEAPAEQ